MYSFIRNLYGRRRHEWHEQRANLFFQLMRPAPGATILDLGGSDGEFMRRVRARVDVNITVADIDAAGLARARASGFHTVQLTEGDALPFSDKQFDIVFCNSVIEHVTLPKAECSSPAITNEQWVARSVKSQAAFGAEVSRIGRGYFVQTPHRRFPIEAHTWLPFVGWMSHSATVKVVRVSDRVWVKHCGYVDWNLLDEDALKTLLPDSRIHIERLWGLPKSLIAYRA